MTLAFGAAVPLAGAAGLPDGRVYEMVTPLENHDAEVYTPLAFSEDLYQGEGDTTTLLPFQAAADGEAVVYAGDPTVGGSGDSGSSEGNEYEATRSAMGGWTQVNLQPLGMDDEGVNNVTGVGSAYYQAFSPDLSVGILQAGGGDEEMTLAPEEMTLAPGAPSHYKVLYTHAADETGSQPLFTTTPPNRSGKEFETSSVPIIDPAASNVLEYAGASANLSQGTVKSSELLFEANDALTANALDGGVKENNLYASVGGRLSLVNVLPDGVGAPDASFGAPAFTYLEYPKRNEPDFSRVISADGSRIFWTDLNTHALYVRENATSTDAVTVPVSAGEAQFWTASTNGEYVFYTENEKLWRFDVEDQAHEELAGTGVQAVIGASEDGSHVYFASTEALAMNENGEGASAQVGQPNLYLLDENNGVTTFIATLSTAVPEGVVNDAKQVIPEMDNIPPFSEVGDLQTGLGERTATVTPNGESLVFMSNNQHVEGFTPELNGTKLEEVYDYDAENGELYCASCDEAHEQSQLKNIFIEGGLGAFLPPDWNSTTEPQWISEDGSRVFFDSLEPLVPQDTNGQGDVYEWERDGTNGCERHGGCIYLLSGGGGKAASWLIGASATGNDVFIVSRAQLTPEDHDETYNVFDARVGGVQPVQPPACAGTGCQGIPATPPTFATPASVTFNGVGNFPAGTAETNPAAAPKAKAKAKLKAKRCKGVFVKRNGRCVKQAARSRESAKGFVHRHGSLWRNSSPGAKFSTKGNYAAGAVLG